jgi:hypothetical protein
MPGLELAVEGRRVWNSILCAAIIVPSTVAVEDIFGAGRAGVGVVVFGVVVLSLHCFWTGHGRLVGTDSTIKKNRRPRRSGFHLKFLYFTVEAQSVIDVLDFEDLCSHKKSSKNHLEDLDHNNPFSNCFLTLLQYVRKRAC